MQVRESSTEAYVKAAKDLRPSILEAREALDRDRKIPPSLAQRVDEAGVYRLFLPGSMGGPQLDPITAYKVIEEVSRAEASVGWCGLLSNGGALFTGNFTVNAAREMFGYPPEFRTAGSFRPLGEARSVPGGFRVTGRWDYASGISNANWLFVNSRLVGKDGPLLNDSGRPQTVMLFTPVETARVFDTWHVVGLCGTGSNDFELDDVFVPVERSFRLYDPPREPGFLYHPRTLLTAIWVLVSAVALGTARGAMDAFRELATESGTTISATLLRDRPHVQARVGEAEAMISGARAHVLDAVGRAWENFSENMPLPSPELTQARLAITHSIHEAARAVDILFHAAGTNAIHRANGLERRWRDVHVVVQHGAGLLSNYEFGGQALMGLQPSDAGW